jgi:hypothetical protein
LRLRVGSGIRAGSVKEFADFFERLAGTRAKGFFVGHEFGFEKDFGEIGKNGSAVRF